MTEFTRKEDGTFEVVVKVLGKPDQHGRVWNPEAMAKAVEKFNERVRTGRAIGELGQPARHAGDSQEYYRYRCSIVDMDNTCCLITDAKIEDNKLIAAMKPAGRWKGSVEQMLEDQVPLTLGIRAFCDVRDGKIHNVRDIVTFDVISPPTD